MTSLLPHLRVAGASLAATIAAAVPLAATAQTAWPDKPLRMIIPFPPGGTLDRIGPGTQVSAITVPSDHERAWFSLAKAGDVVEVEIEGIGVLRNRLEADPS